MTDEELDALRPNSRGFGWGDDKPTAEESTAGKTRPRMPDRTKLLQRIDAALDDEALEIIALAAEDKPGEREIDSRSASRSL